MKRPVKFKPDMSLSTLQAQTNRFQALFGPVIELGNQDGSTIAVFDGDREAEGRIVLRPGSATPGPGETTVCTGDVFIIRQQQKVTAYRLT